MQVRLWYVQLYELLNKTFRNMSNHFYKWYNLKIIIKKKILKNIPKDVIFHVNITATKSPRFPSAPRICNGKFARYSLKTLRSKIEKYRCFEPSRINSRRLVKIHALWLHSYFTITQHDVFPSKTPHNITTSLQNLQWCSLRFTCCHVAGLCLFVLTRQHKAYALYICHLVLAFVKLSFGRVILLIHENSQRNGCQTTWVAQLLFTMH